MPWKKNKKGLARTYPDLEYLPRARCGWDATLAALAFSWRRRLAEAPPDLAAWAARHGVPASQRYLDLGSDAFVLWHGTSRARAEKIVEHGLFHKRGLWTTLEPQIAHGFTRGRSERFGTDGAMVCIVLDHRTVERGRDYDVEGKGDIFRFQHGLPAEVVEYVLVAEEIRFLGRERASRPAPWPAARLSKRDGGWVPVQQVPVRYSDTATYSTLEEFLRLCLHRLADDLGAFAAIELFSTAYGLVSPLDALPHALLLDLLETACVQARRRARVPTFLPREDTTEA
jgi:hypothetical protein